MTWLPVGDEHGDQPQWWELAERHGENAWARAFALDLRAQLWAYRNHTDGQIPRSRVTSLTPLDGAKQVAEHLIEAGLWVETESGYTLVGFLDQKGRHTAAELAELRAADAYRQAKRSAMGNAIKAARASGQKLETVRRQTGASWEAYRETFIARRLAGLPGGAPGDPEPSRRESQREPSAAEASGRPQGVPTDQSRSLSVPGPSDAILTRDSRRDSRPNSQPPSQANKGLALPRGEAPRPPSAAGASTPDAGTVPTPSGYYGTSEFGEVTKTGVVERDDETTSASWSAEDFVIFISDDLDGPEIRMFWGEPDADDDGATGLGLARRLHAELEALELKPGQCADCGQDPGTEADEGWAYGWASMPTASAAELEAVIDRVLGLPGTAAPGA